MPCEGCQSPNRAAAEQSVNLFEKKAQGHQEAFDEAAKNGWEFNAIWHSHFQTQSYKMAAGIQEVVDRCPGPAADGACQINANDIQAVRDTWENF